MIFCHSRWKAETSGMLGYILGSLDRIERKLNAMNNALENLRVEVAKNGDVARSAVTLIQGLKVELDKAITTGDSAELQKLSDDLHARSEELAAAILANTPSDPAKPSPVDPARPFTQPPVV